MLIGKWYQTHFAFALDVMLLLRDTQAEQCKKPRGQETVVRAGSETGTPSDQMTP